MRPLSATAAGARPSPFSSKHQRQWESNAVRSGVNDNSHRYRTWFDFPRPPKVPGRGGDIVLVALSASEHRGTGHGIADQVSVRHDSEGQER